MGRIDGIAAAVAAGMFAAGIMMAVLTYDGYRAGQRFYQDMQDMYTDDESDNSRAENENRELEDSKSGAGGLVIRDNLPDDAPDRISVNWPELKIVNEDIVAWIQLPAVSISYPVLQGEDNTYYLHRSAEKEELFAGSIFMDSFNSPYFDNFNTILYGHNMRDGSMFAKLKDYNAQETLDSCPYFWIYTQNADYLYQIFSVHTAQTGGKAYIVRFKDSKEYTDWLQEISDSTSVKANVSVLDGDKVVTLSTCTGDASARQVIHGVQIYSSAKVLMGE